MDKAWWQLTDEDKRHKRICRTYHRFMTGRMIDGKYVLLTLTTPEDMAKDIHHCWTIFKKRLARINPNILRSYFCVKEYNKKATCTHLHIVCRLTEIDYKTVHDIWKDVTGAVWIHIDKIKNPKGMANYLIKYLTKTMLNAHHKHAYWYSYDWTYKSWIGFHKTMWSLGTQITNLEDHVIHAMSPIDRQSYMTSRILTELATYQGKNIKINLPKP